MWQVIRGAVCDARGLVLAALLSSVLALPSRAAGPELPEGVRLLTRSEWFGWVSPDGRWLAYWTHQGDLKLFSISERRVKSTIGHNRWGLPLVAWAADSRHLATWLKNDGLYLVDVSTKKAQHLDAAENEFLNHRDLALAFSPDGSLFFVKQSTLFQVGWDSGWTRPATSVVAKLPQYARYFAFSSSPAGLLGSTPVLMSGRPIGAGDHFGTIWITDLRTGKTREMATATDAVPIVEAKLSPAGTHVCIRGEGVHCIDLGSGAVRRIASGSTRSWGNDPGWMRSYSPSGDKLSFIVERERSWILFVHSFATGKSRALFDAHPYREHGFQDDHRIVLCDQGVGAPTSLLRLDLAAGTAQFLLPAETATGHEFASPMFIPGQPDYFFIGHERGGTRDLVSVAVTQSAATRPQPLKTQESDEAVIRRDLPDGAACTDRWQCASHACAGPGCSNDQPGVCVPASQTCPGKPIDFCDCEGNTFPQVPECPYRRYRHRGPCR